MKKSEASRVLLLSVGLILSQARVEAAAPAAEPLAEVVVTASRVAREGFSAPTPTTVIGPELLEQRAATNILDVINEQPAFRNTATQQSNSIGAGGNASIDLRGLGTTRTLVLVNGHRHVPTNTNSTININLIPASLIQRTEVVTGGASAAWGSDAVAGVVNLILKNNLQGFESNVSYGASTKGDFDEYTVSLAGGTSFAGGRGHFMAGGEYSDNKGVGLSGFAREWSKERWFTYQPSTRPAGTPGNIVAPDILFSDQLAPDGVIVGPTGSAAQIAGAIALNGGFDSRTVDNTIFLPGGGTGTFVQGRLGGQSMEGGQNDNINLVTGSNIANPVKRYSGLGRVSFDITDSLNAYFEGSFAHSESAGFGPQRRDQANLRIYGNNVFLNAQAPALAAQVGPARSFLMGRLFEEYGHYASFTQQETVRGVLGLEGKFGETWDWDAYYQHGENQTDQKNGNTIQANFYAAIDAIGTSPATATCNPANRAAPRVTINGVQQLQYGAPDAGCVPLNLLGEGSPSAAAIAYVTGIQTNDIKIKQDAAAFNLSGEPFSNWAGPVSIAAGVEYRKESVNANPDANSRASRYEIGNPQPSQGDIEVKEAYLETVFPLLNGKFMAESLDLNAAVRATDYSTSGNVTTWKGGISWQPVDSIRLRATQSRDIRAPNLAELYAGATTGFGQLGYTLGTTAVIPNTLKPTLTTANPDLLPEEADTFTAGIVLTPSWLPGFRTSIDYYSIDIENVISSLGGQTIINNCYNGALVPSGNYYCSLVQFGPNNASIVSVTNPQLNLNKLKTEGIDFEVGYNVPSLGSLPGNLSVRLLATYVDHYITIDTVNPGPTDTAGQIVPDWVWNLGFTYTLERFTGNIQVRHLDSTLRSATSVGPDNSRYNEIVNLPGTTTVLFNGRNTSSANTYNDNKVEAVDYISLSGQYKLIEGGDMNVTLYGVVNNLLDVDPPNGAANNAVGPTLYDLVGRTFRVGARFNF